MPISRARLPVALSFLLLVAMVVSALHAKAPAPEVKKDPATICSFTLGQLFQKTDKENRDRFLKECALDLGQVVKAFDECKVTVVRKKVVREDGKEELNNDLELVVKGKQKFVLQDANNMEVALNVKKITFVLGRVRTSTLPTRFIFHLGFVLDGKHSIKVLGVLEAEHTFTWEFSDRFGYDAEGKSFDPNSGK
jgi:hypothetical protein